MRCQDIFYQFIDCRTCNLRPIRTRRGIPLLCSADRIIHHLFRYLSCINAFIISRYITTQLLWTNLWSIDTFPIFKVKKQPEFKFGITQGKTIIVSFLCPLMQLWQLIISPLILINDEPCLISALKFLFFNWVFIRSSTCSGALSCLFFRHLMRITEFWLLKIAKYWGSVLLPSTPSKNIFR